MKKDTKTFYFFLFLIINATCFSQNQDTLQRVAKIVYTTNGNQVNFKAETPPLNQIAGAPKAFYTYFWEYGDGQYSEKEAPTHVYKKEGKYPVNLWVTNNYDNGAPPKTRPEQVPIDKMTTDQASADDAKAPFVDEDDDLYIKTNRDPLPNQDLVLVTTYRNTKNYVTSGKLYLFYNDKKFKDDNFILEDTRLYNGEQIVENAPLVAGIKETDKTDVYIVSNINNLKKEYFKSIQDSTKRLVLPVTLEESKNLYRNNQLIAFDNMQPGEERTIFRTLKTTPQMLKDTSAIVTLRSIYVPDNNYGNHTVKDTELEIVTSHDPNKMATNGAILNYRLVRFKRINFKVRFQNNGEGPANTIKLEVDTPEMFDKSSLEIIDTYPKVPICPKDKEVNYSCIDTTFQKDKIIFTFQKIYLPGSNQKNVSERDSTKGFVKYSMKFGKDFHKQKTKSRTAIYFDKNPPIYTNYAVTRFTPGISLGAKAGYIFTPSLNNHKEYMAGITVSPYKSYKGYLQAEFFVSANSFNELKNFETSQLNDVGIEEITRFSQNNKEENITAYLVPASYRYNINNFLAVGGGLQLKLDLQNKCLQKISGEGFLNIPGEGEIRYEPNDSYQEISCDKNFTNFQSGIFVGFNVGGVRIGPSVGVRYVQNFNAPTSQIQVYGIWKF
jgi:hypothetical protein